MKVTIEGTSKGVTGAINKLSDSEGRLADALKEIAGMETAYPNATVKRMAKTARDALSQQ
jgi:hypothetical protein